MINSFKYCAFFFEQHFKGVKDIINDIKNIINNISDIISDIEQLCHKPYGLLVNNGNTYCRLFKNQKGVCIPWIVYGRCRGGVAHPH